MDIVKITTNIEKFRNDIADELRAYNHNTVEYKGEGDYFSFNVQVNITEDIAVDVETDLGGLYRHESYSFKDDKTLDEIEHKSYVKFCVKISTYKILEGIYGYSLPYGSLTGIRPTKLFRKYENLGEDAHKVFRERFLVSEEKTNLIEDIVNLQKAYLNTKEDHVDVFVNIPFCPSRCSYCSFVSTDITKQRKYVKDYIKCLQREISVIKNIVLENKYKVRAVYIGGGTPSSLEVNELESIVKLLDFNQDEFTVEVGRPDTITKPLLDMLEKYGVNRISINPQTFNQKTLDRIGRRHSVEQIYDAYNLARNYKFLINMDLIALLPGETYEDFVYSVKETIKLNPDNITIHTLALKIGSRLNEANYDNNDKFESNLASKMVDVSKELVSKAGYVPYYMYRQKNMSGNLENTGYSKGIETACIYNIDIMEENTSILATGAGAIAKRMYLKENRLERLANMKNAKEYIERFDENILKTKKFWKKDNQN